MYFSLEIQLFLLEYLGIISQDIFSRKIDDVLKKPHTTDMPRSSQKLKCCGQSF
jgi:hypothetical protein